MGRDDLVVPAAEAAKILGVDPKRLNNMKDEWGIRWGVSAVTNRTEYVLADVRKAKRKGVS